MSGKCCRAETPVCKEKRPKRNQLTIAVLSRAHPPSYGSTYLSGKAVQTNRAITEILAGATLALVYANHFEFKPKSLISRFNPYLLLCLFVISSSPFGAWTNYLRPYLAAMLVGSTLFSEDSPLTKLLASRVLKYVATISFALYVIHGVFRETWLGSGDTLERYLKRPLLFAATFGLAHLSTFYFEARFIRLGKRLTAEK